MTDEQGSNDPTASPDDDPVLRDAGARLRDRSRGLDATAIQLGALRRQARRRGIAAGVAAVLAVVAVAAAGLVGTRGNDQREVVGGVPGSGPEVDRIVGSLGAQPINPTKVKLVSTVQTFPGCDALIGDLRRVGAQHVGSRGFGADSGMFTTVGMAVRGDFAAEKAASSDQALPVPSGSDQAGAGGETLGTNVQVEGVDELDHVKADGKYIYDLDGRGNLRVTDSTTLGVVGTVNIVADPAATQPRRMEPSQSDSISSLLENDGHLAIFGSRTIVSKPVAGDPSATQSSTQYLTVTFVDATDPNQPKVTDQIQLEGSLVSARLVNGQIRLVTTSNMADLGFVMPTTPTSVAKALDRNRRSVAASTAADWIPDWTRKGGSPQPLVPCDRVHVPTTFAGVAMTSLVSFPIGTGRFAPEATSVLAPGDTLYAGLDDVAISSQVWVDPIDRQRLKFDDWQTAIHEFSFTKDGPPTYEGSGIVDGSTVGQFAFGQIGDSLGVVTTKGTPWNQDTTNAVDLNVLTPDGKGGLAVAAKVDDLAGGKGMVAAVRFMTGRVLVSTGVDGNLVRVVDVTDAAHPRRAGSITLTGETGYFHPLAGSQALLVGSRSDMVPGPNGPISRPWVTAQLLDTSDADHPRIVGSWETPWATDQVGSDHHAFTFWPQRKLALWGVYSAKFGLGTDPNHAVALAIDGAVTQAAFPEAAQPPVAAAPCPTVAVTDPDAQRLVGDDGIVLGCGDPSQVRVDWPRYSCSSISADMVRRYAPDQPGKASYFLCRPAPMPSVSRVLVVNGRPILLTDQTLEALDPTSFASTGVVFHPTDGFFDGMPVY